jgi:hypothetical protein
MFRQYLRFDGKSLVRGYCWGAFRGYVCFFHCFQVKVMGDKIDSDYGSRVGRFGIGGQRSRKAGSYDSRKVG